MASRIRSQESEDATEKPAADSSNPDPQNSGAPQKCLDRKASTESIVSLSTVLDPKSREQLSASEAAQIARVMTKARASAKLAKTDTRKGLEVGPANHNYRHV